MRRFGRMTKEMRLSHREDVLTHALIYYGMRAKKNLVRIYLVVFIQLLLLNFVCNNIFSGVNVGEMEESS